MPKPRPPPRGQPRRKATPTVKIKEDGRRPLIFNLEILILYYSFGKFILSTVNTPDMISSVTIFRAKAQA